MWPLHSAFQGTLTDLGVLVRMIKKYIFTFSNFSPLSSHMGLFQQNCNFKNGVLIIQEVKFLFPYRQIHIILLFVPYCHCCSWWEIFWHVIEWTTFPRLLPRASSESWNLSSLFPWHILGVGNIEQRMWRVDTRSDRGTLEIIIPPWKDKFRILWGWSWTLSRKFGSCKVLTHLERQRLLFCLSYQNPIAKPFLSDFSRKILRFYSHRFHLNFFQLFSRQCGVGK